MSKKILGSRSIQFETPPYIVGSYSIVGKKEGEGPLSSYFDEIQEDPMFGGETWEEAESRLQYQTASKAIESAGYKQEEIRYLLAGDLLGQLIATSFGLMDLQIPLFGIYGACSTMGESISLASTLVEGEFAEKVVALTSSHFAGAEKQFRFPLDYGNQRPLAATWTVTGCGAVVIASEQEKQKHKEKYNTTEPYVAITGVTTGKVVDFGVKDAMNMGACMAPAACDVIYYNLKDFNRKPTDYDKIITGDLGYVGKDILIDMLKEKGYDISGNYLDCGIEIFSKEEQDTHSGGSGCGCSASTLTGYILKKMKKGDWKRILFVPTGALLSPVSFNEGNSVPGIAHGVVLEIL